MVAYVGGPGPAGGPSPPTERKATLQAEIERLRAELATVRRLSYAVHAHLVGCAPHDPQLEDALAAHDNAVREGS